MASETDLCNDALGTIGQSRITAIDDESTSANHCQTFYPMLRDAALTLTHWTFNMVRIELAQDVTPPVFGYSFAYTLPADTLKVIEFNGANVDPTWPYYDWMRRASFSIESGKLLTDYASAFIVYLARVTNPDAWSPLFYQGLVAQLAGKLAFAIPKDTKKGSALLAYGTDLLAQAAAVDGQQGSVSPMRTDDLLWGRR